MRLFVGGTVASGTVCQWYSLSAALFVCNTNLYNFDLAVVDGVMPRFTGVSFLQIRIAAQPLARQLVVHVEIIPKSVSGLLFYSGRVNEDFVSLSFVKQKVIFRQVSGIILCASRTVPVLAVSSRCYFIFIMCILLYCIPLFSHAVSIV